MTDNLFIGYGNSHDFFRQEDEEVRNHIDNLDNSDLKQSNDLLTPLLSSKFKKEEIILSSPQKEDAGEGRSSYNGQIVKKIFIKMDFSGDERMFRYTPSTFSMLFPRGEIRFGQIRSTFEFHPHDSSQNFKHEIERNTENIKTFVERMNNDIQSFNNSLPVKIRNWVESRRQRLDSYNEAFDSIEFENASNQLKEEIFFENPTEKIQLEIENNDATEPFLKDAIFQSITESINKIGKSYETVSPELRNLGEEQIRDFFLACLKSSYGNLSLTGESFNRTGKTDVLIKYEDSNLYVSEFKIWRDENRLMEGVTQLLNNLTWRDSKCSYVVFSRNRGFTEIITKIKELVSGHENYIELESQIDETSFKFKFKNINDDSKIVSLNLHIFNIA